jgi:spectinomycin phosphotransferase
MLERPVLDEGKIYDCLRHEYGLTVATLTFLPLGADRHTAVYRADSGEAASYFVKLRQAGFDETTALVPRLLFEQGVAQVIAPLLARAGRLWASFGEFTVIVSPFVEGRDGYQIRLSDDHWIELGRALKGLHTSALPSDVTSRIPRETFSPQWREIVRAFQAQAERVRFDDPVADEMASLLRAKRGVVDDLVGHADRLANLLRARSPDYVVCHADIHAGNVFIDKRSVLYLVDWDTLTLAPKERDLMFPGSGLFGGGRTAAEEEALFYRGYGPAPVDSVAIAYYRCERIVQDIAAYGEQILLTDAGGDDRAEGLRQLSGQFEPGAVVEIALRSAAAPNLS